MEETGCSPVRECEARFGGRDHVCALQVPGVIQTHDGALIKFEGREFAMPLSDGSQQWRVAGVLRFKTDDRRYTWLNDTFALTSGTFDYESGMARWTAFVPRREAGRKCLQQKESREP